MQQANLALFQQHLLPLLNGTSPATRLPGARLTALQVDTGPSLATWRTVAQQNGFAGLAFVYACDEPGTSQAAWNSCQQAANAATQTWPDVPVLVTASIQQVNQFNASGYVNWLVVLVNQMHDKPGQRNAGNQRPNYNAFLALNPKNEVWLHVVHVTRLRAQSRH